MCLDGRSSPKDFPAVCFGVCEGSLFGVQFFCFCEVFPVWGGLKGFPCFFVGVCEGSLFGGVFFFLQRFQHSLVQRRPEMTSWSSCVGVFFVLGPEA